MSKRDILNERRRVSPRLYDFCYIICRSHLTTFRYFISVLRQVVTTPIVIDIGCGSKPMQKFFRECQYFGIDVDIKGKPDIIADCNEGYFPFANCSIDAVVFSNSLEHIFNCPLVFEEIERVVKKDGLVFFSVPMTFPIHAHPDDYHRFTPYYFTRVFSGWKILQLNVTNSIFSTPIFLVAHLLEMFLPACLNCIPISFLNSSILLVDNITKFIFHVINVDILKKVWSSCPIEINGVIKKTWNSYPNKSKEGE